MLYLEFLVNLQKAFDKYKKIWRNAIKVSLDHCHIINIAKTNRQGTVNEQHIHVLNLQKYPDFN